MKDITEEKFTVDNKGIGKRNKRKSYLAQRMKEREKDRMRHSMHAHLAYAENQKVAKESVVCTC